MSVSGRRTRLAALLTLACLSLLACHSSGQRAVDAAAADRLEPLLLDLPTGAYRPGPADATGPLDRDEAAQATVVPPQQLADYLGAHGFVAGYSRVWTVAGSPDAYVTAIVLGFGTHAQAQGVVDLAVTSLHAALGTYLAPMDDIPGGQAYGLSGQQRVSGHYLFCAGAWFAVGADAFTVTLCSTARPVALEEAEPFARMQYQRVVVPTVGNS